MTCKDAENTNLRNHKPIRVALAAGRKTNSYNSLLAVKNQFVAAGNKEDCSIVFKHAADRIPVTLILLLSGLDFFLYFFLDNIVFLAIYFVLMFLPKSQICAWNHHHQHTPTFRYKALNRLLEFFYALHTGVTTNLWLLHHVLGHHHNFLDQEKDQSRWRNNNGEQMGEVEYTLHVASTAYYRGYLVGKHHPAAQKTFLVFGGITFLVLGLLVWLNPIPALFLFVLPMITGMLVTAWATYEHHAGLNTDNEFEASFNNTNYWYNLFTGNLGYHTAHHHKQGVHWSKLPALHDQIKHQIPGKLIRTSWI